MRYFRESEAGVSRQETKLFDNLWLSLIVVLLIDSLANPYAGFIYDARLYGLQALAHVHPGRYARDLFFLFGSQDSFSIFSTLQASVIKATNLYHGTWLLYFGSKILFYGGLLAFLRAFLKQNSLAFLVCCFLAAGPAHYIAFDANEPFLTPRLASEAFGLIAVASYLRGGRWLPFLFLLIAGLLHPLMAIGPAAIIVLLWLWGKNRRTVGLVLGGAAVLGLCAYFVAGQAIRGLDLFTPFDTKWLDIVKKYNGCVVPGKWCAGDWEAMLGSLLIIVFSFPSLTPGQKRLVFVSTVVAAGGVLLTVFGVYVLPLVILAQLQLWRAWWVVDLLVPCLAFLWASRLWHADNRLFRLVVPPLVIPILLGAGMTGDALPWLVAAGCFTLVVSRLSVRLRKETVLLLVAAESIAIVIPWLAGLWLRAQGALLSGPVFSRNALFILVAVLGPFARPVAVFLGGLGGRRKPGPFIFGGVALLLFCLVLPSGSASYRIPVLPGRFLPAQLDRHTVDALHGWRKKIPAGSVILADKSVQVEDIWFDLASCDYVSDAQNGGAVFNRSLALEYLKRKKDREDFFGKDMPASPRSWCIARGINYVLTSRSISLPQIGSFRGIKLYAVDE